MATIFSRKKPNGSKHDSPLQHSLNNILSKQKKENQKSLGIFKLVFIGVVILFMVLLVRGIYVRSKSQNPFSKYRNFTGAQVQEIVKPWSYKKFKEEFSKSQVSAINGSIFEEGIIGRALRARAKGKEIIIQAIDFGPDHLYDRAEVQFNSLQNLFNLDYTHVLAIAITKYSCDKVMEMYPNMGCLYGDIINDVPAIGSSNVGKRLKHSRHKIWTLRYMLMFKAIQHGYNAMILDSDAYITRDVYRALKSEQLSEYQWIASVDYDVFLNGGFQYVQNALPNGPVAWSIFQIPYYTIRKSEEASTDTVFTIEDQNILTNALYACMCGKPIYKVLRYTGYWTNGKLDDVGWEGLWQISGYLPNVFKKFKSHNFDNFKDQTNTLKAYSTDKKHRRGQNEMANETLDYLLEYYDLSLPYLHPEEDVIETRQQFSKGMGPATQWLFQFAAENGSFKLWPDEYQDKVYGGEYSKLNISTELPEYREVAREKIVLAPKFVYDEFCHDGAGMRQMFQSDGDQHLVSSCGVCHFNCLYKSWGQEDRKELFKHFGWWNWDTMLRLHEGKIFRNFNADVSKEAVRKKRTLELPKLLALNPKMDINASDEREMGGYIDELRKLAGALGRRLVWPYINCKSKMFKKDENTRLGIQQDDNGEFQVIGNSSFGCKVLWVGYMQEPYMSCGFSTGDFIYYKHISNWSNPVNSFQQLFSRNQVTMNESDIQSMASQNVDNQVVLIDYLPKLVLNETSGEYKKAQNAFANGCPKLQKPQKE